MKKKSEMKYEDRLDNGGKYFPCDNPECENAVHYMKDISYSMLNQDREDGKILDVSFCSLDCLIEADKNKEDFLL